MTDYGALMAKQKKLLDKALARLEASARKVESLSTAAETLDDEALEIWESFMARFGRASDLFMSKLMRTLVLDADPGFFGSFRDFLNQAEKLGWVDAAEPWLTIRELRNVWAHEYAEDALAETLAQSRELAPTLLGLRTRLRLSPGRA